MPSYLRNGVYNSSAVEELQRKLNAAGYSPKLAVDGDFGPKTEAAVRWYQQKNNLAVDGIVGPETGGHLGLSGYGGSSTGSSSGSSSSGTSTTSKQLDLIGVPGEGELWKVGSSYYLVYQVPNSTTRISYKVRKEDLQAMFGPDRKWVFNRVMTWEQYRKTGTVNMGNRTELQGEDEHPFDALVSQFKTEAQVRPWLRDPEVLAVVTAAYLEGRPVTEAELQTTEWFRSRSPAERAWAVLREADPVAAQEKLQDARLVVQDSLRELGINNAPWSLVKFLADKTTTGAWTNEYLARQAQKLADPYFGLGGLDADLQKFVKGMGVELDHTRKHEDTVRNLVSEWLGGKVAGNWTDQRIATWAGRLRNDPDAEQQLVDALRKQRLALYPMYENPDLTYNDIAAAWEPFYSEHWGQTTEADPDLFDQVLRLNDSNESGKLLRKEGIKRGNDYVTNQLLSEMTREFTPVREDVN